MTEDIILITVDALRHDTGHLLNSTKDHFHDAETGEAITSGSATNWVFPGVLSGTYYPAAYDEDGLVRDDLRSLPDVLESAGYETGAFLGFNPYLSKWSDRFDTFWNGGIDDADEEWYSNSIEKWLSRGYRTALLKKRVPGSEVVDRASTWYTETESPRFLWIHIMEPHGPYYPGLDEALDVGLLRSYRSILNFQRDGDDAPQRDIDVQRELYEKCVTVADRLIDDILSFVDDESVVAILGDHGEEFEHGHIDHERLYDECVCVPLFCRNIDHETPLDTVRQIDLPAELLDAVGQNVPDEWDAEKFGTDTPAFMLSPWADDDTFRYAVRTDGDKLIQTFDLQTGESLQNEYYDLDSDPDERIDRYESSDTEGLEAQLTEFIDRYSNALDIDPETGIDSSAVEERLENLGYK